MKPSNRFVIIGFLYNFAKVLMVVGPLIFAAMMCAEKDARAASFFELRKAAIEGGSYLGTNHDFLLELDRPGERLQHTTDLIMDIDLACSYYDEVCLYFNNTVLSKASNEQYRGVGWSFKVGLALGRYLEIGWRHLSTHAIDRSPGGFARFGLENVAYIQFKWYENPRKRGY